MLGKSFLSICELSISASLPIAVFLFAAPILRTRFAAKWNYRIWVFLALWLMIPFYKMVPAESFGQIQAYINRQLTNLQPDQSRHAEKQSAERLSDQIYDAERPDRQLTVALPPQLTAPIIRSSETHMRDITGLEIAAVIWLLGSICFFGMHLYGCCRYKKEILMEGTLMKDGEIFQQFQELLEEFKIRQKITLMHYAKAGSPMVIGLIHPVLVLPDQSYSPQELYFILKHELVHMKRKDIYFKLLFVAVNALHWFNPLVRLMCRRAVMDIELSCDEAVVQNTAFHIRKAYTETLLSAIHKQCARKSSLSTQFYGGKQIMKKRFENILLRTKKKSGVSVFICSVVLITMLGNLAGCSLMDTFSEESSDSAGDARSDTLSQRSGLNADREDIGNGKEEQSDQVETDDGKAGQKDSDEGNTDQKDSDEGNTDQKDSDESRTDQEQPDEGRSDQEQSNKSKTNQEQPNEGRTDQEQPNEGRTDQEQPDKGRTDQLSDKERAVQDTDEKRSSNKAYEIFAYIADFDSNDMSLDIDEVEWVTVPSERATELGVADSHMDSGFYIYNEEEKLEKLTLAQDCRCSLLNWYSSYEQMEVTVEELFEILQERKELTTGTPYILTIQKNKIIEIQEHYVP